MNGQKLLNLNKLASKCLIGNYSTKTINSLNIFDRKVKKIQRNRIASDPSNTDYDYLKSEVGYRVVDRIFDIKRSFNTILDLGCQKGYVSRHLSKVNISFIKNCSNFL
jgi:NADH dehydrogenase [ubiquinone] 1 alpha subcomplex assembly factor 5